MRVRSATRSSVRMLNCADKWLNRNRYNSPKVPHRAETKHARNQDLEYFVGFHVKFRGDLRVLNGARAIPLYEPCGRDGQNM